LGGGAGKWINCGRAGYTRKSASNVGSASAQAAAGSASASAPPGFPIVGMGASAGGDRATAVILSGAGCDQAWNPAAERIYGWSEKEALAMNAAERIPQPRQAAEQARPRQLIESQLLVPFRTEHTERIARSGKVLSAWVTATALVNDAGQVYAIATTEGICDA
jgi:PAS domain S-box-containing protein